MGARVYDSDTGTFLQTDPIPGADANAYGYTDGDPVNETDLSGDIAFRAACVAAALWCAGTNSNDENFRSFPNRRVDDPHFFSKDNDIPEKSELETRGPSEPGPETEPTKPWDEPGFRSGETGAQSESDDGGRAADDASRDGGGDAAVEGGTDAAEGAAEAGGGEEAVDVIIIIVFL